ncbi:polysaccharide pyruvyl transferase family protein [Niallia taxi]|uniref:polysaccharide pyruvyl transferase family protein n=1 Tax=Niallia taxi TaxID=2499688 RepID=UPI003D2CFE6B
MINKIKNLLPKTVKIQMNYYRLKNENLTRYNKETPKVVVALAADYGNLGDLAITKAQVEFIKEHFHNHEIIEFPIGEIYKHLWQLRRVCSENDIITLIGGGNMGDAYEYFEECRRTIIRYFPKNKIISFPQTFDFSQSELGKESREKSVKVYSQHRDLHIFAREVISYNSMKKYFKENNVYLVPDIVLSLTKVEPQFERSGITLCLRDDMETKVSSDSKENLIKLIKEKYNNVSSYDTHIGDRNYNINSRDYELEQIWNAFKKSSVVITDRLHGMIFCAITKTPCIVFPNSNHKIVGSYEKWLSNTGYIKLFEQIDEKLIMQSIEELIHADTEKFKEINLSDSYEKLTQVLKVSIKNI